MVKKQLDQFCGVRSYFLCPVFLPLLIFVIGHIARYAPSSKFQNQQKYKSKLLNLFFYHYYKKREGQAEIQYAFLQANDGERELMESKA